MKSRRYFKCVNCRRPLGRVSRVRTACEACEDELFMGMPEHRARPFDYCGTEEIDDAIERGVL